MSLLGYKKRIHNSLSDYERNDIDALKGLLIFFIVLAHNNHFSASNHFLFLALYSFHVFCFLALPFIFPVKNFNLQTIKDYFIRYYVPFIIFYLISSIIYSNLYAPSENIIMWTGKVLLSIVIGSPILVKEMSGFQLFWYLPTLFSLVFIRTWYKSQKPGFQILTLILFLIIHLFVGGINKTLKTYIPLGLPIASFCFILCVIIEFLARFLANTPKWVIAISGIFIATFLFNLQKKLGSEVNLGDVHFYTIFHPYQLIVHDAIAIVVFLTLYSLSGILSSFNILVILGKNSLVIYLIHSLVFQSFLKLSQYFNSVELSNTLLLISSIIYTLLFSLFVAISIDKFPFIKNFLTPKKWTEWPAIKRA